MSEHSVYHAHMRLRSRPMLALLAAQFASAMADNALFVLVLTVLAGNGGAGLAPAAQGVFVLSFILLAPFVGPFADSRPKGQVMMLANGIKLVGAGFVLAGGHPLAGYALVGLGAAAYSPAKYGILSQMFDQAQLVKANGLLEGSTIVAILLGVVTGGALADAHLSLALWLVVGLYGAASALNLLIPKLPVERPLEHLRPGAFLQAFWSDARTLLRVPAARFSLIGSGTFWGFGATLRLLLFAWVPAALLISDTQTPANLMGAVSVGIVVGAVLAGMFIKMSTVPRALIGGVLLGPLVIALSFQTHLLPTALLLAAIGIAGGVFAIPLNAVLQEAGHESIGAGRALAVQNLMENSLILSMVGVYHWLNGQGLAPQHTAAVFGVLMVLVTGVLVLRRASLRAPR